MLHPSKVSSGGCPSWAGHRHSVTSMWVKTAVKEESSGLHAYTPKEILPAPSHIWHTRI